MKNLNAVVILFSMLIISSFATPVTNRTFNMSIVDLYTTNKTEWITAPLKTTEITPDGRSMRIRTLGEKKRYWIILLDKTIAFDSVESLKVFLKYQPKGTKLIWAPDCFSIGGGGERLLRNPKEMGSFKSFCKKNSIEFVIIPSG